MFSDWKNRDADGQSVYFRGWGEFFHHSLQLTEGPVPRDQRTPDGGPRGQRNSTLTVKRLEGGWLRNRLAESRQSVMAPAYRFSGSGWPAPRGVLGVRSATSRLPELAPKVPMGRSRYLTRGAGARRIDHVTFNTDDPFRDAKWFQDTLGFRFMEFAKLDHANVVVTALVSSTPMSHDLGLVLDAVDRTVRLSGVKGRANHLAFWVDTPRGCFALLRTFMSRPG